LFPVSDPRAQAPSTEIVVPAAAARPSVSMKERRFMPQVARPSGRPPPNREAQHPVRRAVRDRNEGLPRSASIRSRSSMAGDGVRQEHAFACARCQRRRCAAVGRAGIRFLRCHSALIMGAPGESPERARAEWWGDIILRPARPAAKREDPTSRQESRPPSARQARSGSGSGSTGLPPVHRATFANSPAATSS
jgi:hypothetical protein